MGEIDSTKAQSSGNWEHNSWDVWSVSPGIMMRFPVLFRWPFTQLLFAPALPELLWLPTVWRCPYIEIAFSTLDCSIVPTCGAWCSATAAKRGPLKQSWAEIQHSRDDEPLGVLMQMRNVRVNGFFFFSSLGVLPGVLVDTLSLCSGDFCVECVLIVLHTFYIEL